MISASGYGLGTVPTRYLSSLLTGALILCADTPSLYPRLLACLCLELLATLSGCLSLLTFSLISVHHSSRPASLIDAACFLLGFQLYLPTLFTLHRTLADPVCFLLLPLALSPCLTPASMDDDDYDALPPLPPRLPPFTVGHEQYDDYEEAPPPLPRKAWKPTLRRPADRVLKFDRAAAAETEIDSVDDLSRATRSQSTSTTDLPSIELSVPRSTLYLSQSTSTTDLAKDDQNEFGFSAEPAAAAVIDMTPTSSFADAAAAPVAAAEPVATAITLPAMYMSTDFTAPPPASDVSSALPSTNFTAPLPASDVSSALPSAEAPSRTVELYTDMQLDDSTEPIVVEQPAMTQAQEPVGIDIVMSQSFPDSTTDDDVVIDLPPSKQTPRGSSNRPHWSSRRSSRSSGSKTPGPAADTDAIFKGSYIEMFTIGGGTRWFYALLDFIMAILVFMKHLGVPAAGQMVDAYHELLELPLAGALLKFCFGASARHAYKIAGAYKHPELELYWKAKPSLCQRVCQNIKNPDPPYNTPFPAVEYNSRGTPEHLPFTDFDNAISANERGALWDSICNGGARGFKARFKTGTRHQKGTTLFDVRREPASSLFSVCCLGMMSVACYFTCAHKCCQTCCKCQAKAKQYVTVRRLCAPVETNVILYEAIPQPL